MLSVKRIGKSFSLVLLAVIALEILFGPIRLLAYQVGLQQLRRELIKEKEKWNSQNIAYYSFEVGYLAAPVGHCYARITLIQNEIVEISERQGTNENSPFVEKKKDQWDNGYCNYSRFTFLNVFDMLLNEKTAKVNAEFDPQYGYVTFYSINENVVRWCFFCEVVSETGLGVTFSNFQRLDSSVP